MDFKDKLILGVISICFTVIITGIGWLIVQNESRLDTHELKLQMLENSVNDLRNISSNLIEAYNGKVDKDKAQDQELQKQRDEILELWKCSRRGASNLTLKQ